MAIIPSVSRNSLTLDAGGVKVELMRHAYQWQAPVKELEGVSLVPLPDLSAIKLKLRGNRFFNPNAPSSCFVPGWRAGKFAIRERLSTPDRAR